ncbi:MAG: cation:proton antiporter, partial [Chloroflexota bacterium]
MFSIPPPVLYFASFVIVAIAAHEIGHFLGRFKLPHITGYLLAGLLIGPFVLNLIPTEAIDGLRFVDEISLAVIAFVAGSELYLKELRSRMRPILLNALGITVAALIIITTAVYYLTQFIPFAEGLSNTARLAVALLGGTVLLALSPASTIAVIQEVRARGPFTKTILSVTVVMDIVIIVLFAISTALAAALLFNEPMNASFVALLALDLTIAVMAGYLIGRLLELVLGQTWITPIKIALVLGIGFGVFWTGFQLTDISKANFPFTIHAEPLLTSMIAGFYVTNFTAYRQEFERLLHDVSPVIYVAFFTLTGIALKLDVLLASIGIAIVLFGVRALSIFIGSFAGATLAGEPMRFRRVAWLALITQAGIALGLAREVSVQFPDTLGSDFATLIIAVVVLNEIFGPIFLKFALRNVGESHEPETAHP